MWVCAFRKLCRLPLDETHSSSSELQGHYAVVVPVLGPAASSQRAQIGRESSKGASSLVESRAFEARFVSPFEPWSCFAKVERANFLKPFVKTFCRVASILIATWGRDEGMGMAIWNVVNDTWHSAVSAVPALQDNEWQRKRVTKCTVWCGVQKCFGNLSPNPSINAAYVYVCVERCRDTDNRWIYHFNVNACIQFRALLSFPYIIIYSYLVLISVIYLYLFIYIHIYSYVYFIFILCIYFYFICIYFFIYI